jgi:hypothetical protein
VFRRQEAQPPVHGREPVDLRPLCRDPGGLGRLTRPRRGARATLARMPGAGGAGVRRWQGGKGSAPAGRRRSLGVEVAPIVRQRGAPPTVTQGKPVAMVLTPSPHLYTASAHHGLLTQPTQLLDRGVRLLSQRYWYHHSIIEHTSCVPLPWRLYPGYPLLTPGFAGGIYPFLSIFSRWHASSLIPHYLLRERRN